MKSSVVDRLKAYKVSKPNGNPIDKVKGEAKYQPNFEEYALSLGSKCTGFEARWSP